MTLVFGVIGVAQALILIYFLGHFNMPTELLDSLLVAGVSGLSFLGEWMLHIKIHGNSLRTVSNNLLNHFRSNGDCASVEVRASGSGCSYTVV